MVMKLKAPPAKEPLFRIVRCGQCQWTVAAATYQALLGAGWQGCSGKIKETDKRLVWCWICKTCAGRVAKTHPKFLGMMPGGAKFFRSLPAAPESPYPCVGVEGHETSRPEVEETPPIEVMS